MTQLNRLPPLYRFVLNPYEDVRFSTCPECSQRTLLRKVPLLIHIDPLHPLLLNKHCRYCRDCDLLIVHQDELEDQMTIAFKESNPEIIGNDYLVLGTVNKATWRRQLKEPIPRENLRDYLHPFKEYLSLSHRPAGWFPSDQASKSAEKPSPSRLPNEAHGVIDPVSTIDDIQQVESLLKAMESQLPIPAELLRGAASNLRAQGAIIPPHRNVEIHKVFYNGDAGGILCGISPKNSKEPILISLTHLKIPYRHPLEKEIRAYQKKRIKRIREQS